MNDWEQIIDYVKRMPYQQDVWILKDSVLHPDILGFPKTFFAYRFVISNEQVIDIKEVGYYFKVHWDKYDPNTNLLDHALEDAPLEFVFATAGIGALVSPEGKKGEGALKGLGIGALLVALRAWGNKQKGEYN